MKIMNVADFKSQFSDVIKAIREGKEIAVSYGKKHETIGIFIPFSKYSAKKNRKLGLLKNKASFSFSRNYKIKDEELFNS